MNNNATNHNCYARHNTQIEMAVMEPVFEYPNLLVGQLAGQGSALLDSPLPSGGTWKTQSLLPQTGEPWVFLETVEIIPMQLKTLLKVCWRCSHLLLLSRHPGMYPPGLLQSWLLQVSVIRGDSMMQLWMTVLLKHLGHACWLEGVNAAVSHVENSCACCYQVVLLQLIFDELFKCQHRVSCICFRRSQCCEQLL